MLAAEGVLHSGLAREAAAAALTAAGATSAVGVLVCQGLDWASKALWRCILWRHLWSLSFLAAPDVGVVGVEALIRLGLNLYIQRPLLLTAVEGAR